MTGSSAFRPPLPPREAAAAVAAKLSARGFVAFFAGGCVRDHLSGIEPTDYDIATDATPVQITEIFKGARGVGESFGVMLVRSGGRTIEVATFRSEGAYHDGRRPSEVRFSSASDDAQRRDFTINGLFENPVTGEVIDFVGGVADLKGKLLRAIGDPQKRFEEDRLRTLRAARFAARFGLDIDAATEGAIREFSQDLKGVSPERIGGEVRRMLGHSTRASAIARLESWGLDRICLGETGSCGELARITALENVVSFPCALAAWSLDRRDRTHSPAQGNWAGSLMLSNREASDLRDILVLAPFIRCEWARLAKCRRKRTASGANFEDALRVLSGTEPALVEGVRREVVRLATDAGGLSPEPFISGHTLIERGLAPGPRFKQILDELYDRQLEGEFASVADAIAALAAMKG